MLLPCLYICALLLATLSGVPGLLGARQGGRIATGMLAAAALAGLAVSGGVLYAGQGWRLDLGWALPGARLALGGDPLGAFVLAPVALVPACLSRYAEGYWDGPAHAATAPRLRFFFGLAAGSLIALTAAANAILFLFAWETMALTGFLMITASDQDAAVREAGWVYLVASHTGVLLLFAGFSLLARATGSFALGPLPAGFAATPAGTWAFLLLLAGFALKAGIGPLHVWLPGAHTAAPSHVSAMLSGLLLKMGLLGIIRLVAWFPDPPLWWGGLLTCVGAVSGVMALAFALAQRDLKRMLAYSSIENVSIVALGLGLALAGKSLGLPALVLLGGAGALFHLLNHALLKPLLFMGAGTVLHATGTRDMERLGGLARAMPRTALCFTAGAFGLSALPPLNAFAGEWLLYLGAFHSLQAGGWVGAIAILAGLAVMGALALATFTRACGVVFLGEPRTEVALRAHEPPSSMTGPMTLLLGVCLLLGLCPLLLAPALQRAAEALAPGLPPLRSLAPLGHLSFVAAAALPVAWAAWRIALRLPGRTAGTWDCGYARPTARIQYTATSFSQMLTDAFRWLLAPVERLPRIQGLFPRNARYQMQAPDTLLERGLKPGAAFLAWALSRLRFLQAGHLPIYLLYVVLTLVALLAWTLA
ncbi:proton-conducting transporter transmembrane domain-containing protein [Mesoterricola sediminis]|uniref:Hydrogenase n=1 Tax=Mesoterricola sediminis TaxID=2927980 RepID=A0AA48GXC1_9BACT|nr:proton-conducting transporter membrane subunit [Mesoterricola sediminis]BDU75782.1 hydrogenase [Mesoterricola sediminis]